MPVMHPRLVRPVDELYACITEKISSAPTSYATPSATVKKVKFICFTKFYEKLWMLTTYVCTISKNFSFKFKMNIEKQKRQI